jgi:hypothetical protein
MIGSTLNYRRVGLCSRSYNIMSEYRRSIVVMLVAGQLGVSGDSSNS